MAASKPLATPLFSQATFVLGGGLAYAAAFTIIESDCWFTEMGETGMGGFLLFGFVFFGGMLWQGIGWKVNWPDLRQVLYEIHVLALVLLAALSVQFFQRFRGAYWDSEVLFVALLHMMSALMLILFYMLILWPRPSRESEQFGEQTLRYRTLSEWKQRWTGISLRVARALAIVMLIIWLYSRDEDLNNQYMLPRRRTLPTSVNAFAELEQIVFDLCGKELDILKAYLDGNDEDKERAAEIVGRHEGTMAEFRQAIAGKRLQSPILEPGEDTLYLAHWFRWCRLQRVAARLDAKAGKYDVAASRLCDAYRFCGLAGKGDGTSRSLAMALRMQPDLLSDLTRIFQHLRTPDAIIDDLAKEECNPTEDDQIYAEKCHYAFRQKQLNQKIDDMWSQSYLARAVFKRNESLNIAAEAHGRTGFYRKLRVWPEDSLLVWLLLPNSYGKLEESRAFLWLRGVTREEMIEIERIHTCLEVAAELIAFHREKGHLPHKVQSVRYRIGLAIYTHTVDYDPSQKVVYIGDVSEGASVREHADIWIDLSSISPGPVRDEKETKKQQLPSWVDGLPLNR